jgi:hypothetical protein
MSPIVIAWIALAIVGLWVSHLNGLEAIRDYQALGGKLNGRRTIAIGNLRREIVRGMIQLDFIIIGVLAIMEVRAVAVPGLFLASAGMVLNSYLDRRDRIYLLRYGLQARDESGRFVKDD